MKYYLSIDNDVPGPYEIHQIAQLYQQGVIDANSQIMADNGSKNWKPLIEYLPSIATLKTTPSLFRTLIPSPPLEATPPIDRDIYVGRIRTSSSYKTLRGYLNISCQIAQLGWLVAVIVVAHSIYIMEHGHGLIVIAAILSVLLGWFVLSAGYQASLLFIDIADCLIDIGRRES